MIMQGLGARAHPVLILWGSFGKTLSCLYYVVRLVPHNARHARQVPRFCLGATSMGSSLSFLARHCPGALVYF